MIWFYIIGYLIIGLVTKFYIDRGYLNDYEKSNKSVYAKIAYEEGVLSTWLALLLWPAFVGILLVLGAHVYYVKFLEYSNKTKK